MRETRKLTVAVSDDQGTVLDSFDVEVDVPLDYGDRKTARQAVVEAAFDIQAGLQ